MIPFMPRSKHVSLVYADVSQSEAQKVSHLCFDWSTHSTVSFTSVYLAAAFDGHSATLMQHQVAIGGNFSIREKRTKNAAKFAYFHLY